MMKFKLLLNKLRQGITTERLVWSAALLITAVAFLELGRSHPYPIRYAPTDSPVVSAAAERETTGSLPAIPTTVPQPGADATAAPPATSVTTGTVKQTTYATAARTTVTAAPSAVVPGEKINLNTATKEQLMAVNGIGEVLAERIIAYRERTGGFSSLEQLKEIERIGDKRYEKLSPYFTVE